MARVERVSQAAVVGGALTVATSLGLFFYSKVRGVQSIGRMPLNVKALGSAAAIGLALAALGRASKRREIRKSKRLEILRQTQPGSWRSRGGAMPPQ